MKILLVTPYSPWPPHSGHQIRVANLLEALWREGHDVSLLVGHEEGTPSIGPARERSANIWTFRTRKTSGRRLAARSLFSPHPYPFQRFLVRDLRKTLAGILRENRFDLIFMNFTILAHAIPSWLPMGTKVVVDEGESLELLWEDVRRQGSWMERGFARLNSSKVKRSESKALTKVHGLLCVSSDEADLRKGDHPRVFEIPNGVDTTSLLPSRKDAFDRRRILFCGTFAVRRNVEAARWFVERVFPSVRSKCPDAEFWIVGRDPTPAAQELARHAGVHVTGTVPDVRPFYGSARVAVLPYSFGAGTKLKALEAMSMGVPIVSTRLGVRGLKVQEGVHAAVSDDPEAFAAEVVRLFKDPGAADKMGRAARRLAESEYSWQRVGRRLNEALRTLVGLNGGASTAASKVAAPGRNSPVEH